MKTPKNIGQKAMSFEQNFEVDPVDLYNSLIAGKGSGPP
jgi:hypothetical protein